MSDQGMNYRDLLEGLLELASAAELEVRVQSQAAATQENALIQSAACRVGNRIWVVLSPSDPPDYQADVLGEALARFRSEFLEDHFMAPVLREFLERVDPLRR